MSMEDVCGRAHALKILSTKKYKKATENHDDDDDSDEWSLDCVCGVPKSGKLPVFTEVCKPANKQASVKTD